MCLTLALAEAGQALEIQVEDSGVGIAQAEQAKLFTPFSRIHTAGASAPEGTGLGLHLSQQMAHLLGGRITVRSEPGQGSCFTLHLPL